MTTSQNPKHTALTSALELIEVSKRYADGTIGLQPLNLSLAVGERFALLGPSGSGKTTLLRLIAGLEMLSSGQIIRAGQPIHALPPHRRGVGLLPQRPVLYPQLTVAKNLQVQGRPCPPEIVARLGLQDRLNFYPHQLSGGQRQRAALAKLLHQNPPLWLLDEPFSSLDPLFRGEFRHDLHLLLEQTSATILFVTHDPRDALCLGQRIGVLGEGRILQIGTASELRDHPNHRFVAACFGRYHLIDGQISPGLAPPAAGSAKAFRDHGGDHEPSGWEFRSRCGSIVVGLPTPWVKWWFEHNRGTHLTLGIRPEDVHLQPLGHQGSNDRNSLPERTVSGWLVVGVEPLGCGWLLTLRPDHGRVEVGTIVSTPQPLGSRLDWFFSIDRCLCFDGHGQRIPFERRETV